MTSSCCLYWQLLTFITPISVFLLVTISKQLFAGLVLFSVVFFIQGEDQPQKFLFSYHCITFLWFWECLEAAGRIFFTKEVLFKILQNLQKTTCAAVFLNKVRLATLINKYSGNGVFLWTFQIFKGTFLCKTPPDDCLID